MAPASTVLVPSAVSEGGDLFGALLAHLRRRYPEVYGLGENTARAPDRREIQIRTGEEICGGNLSLNSSLNLGAYASRLDNINLVGINNHSPNLTTVYLDNPLVGPTLDPLEYVPSPGRLGQPSRYPPRTTGPQSGSACRRPLTPPHPKKMHPRMHASTGQAKQHRVVHATVLGENSKRLAPRGEPRAKFGSAVLERPNPPTHAYKHRGGGASLWVQKTEATDREKIRF